jgi:hypothetical protein
MCVVYERITHAGQHSHKIGHWIHLRLPDVQDRRFVSHLVHEFLMKVPKKRLGTDCRAVLQSVARKNFDLAGKLIWVKVLRHKTADNVSTSVCCKSDIGRKSKKYE